MSRVRPTHPLVALSSAAVIAVYSAGYLKTRAAAAKFSDAPAMRRPAHVSASGSVVAPPTEHDLAPVVKSAPAAAAPAVIKVRTKKHAATTESAAQSSNLTAIAVVPQKPDTHEPPAPAAAPDRPAVDVAAATPVTIAAPPPEPAADTAAKSLWHDGTYSGWGSSRHGDIQATIVIESGRITSARISQCLTRYSCSWIAHLQGQVVDRQSADVDYVSGATQSSNAFYGAIVDALSKATK